MKKNSNQIYEIEGVYGDEEKFTATSRFNKMLNIIRNLGYTPKRVLDIGCGTGFFANEIKKIYPKATIYGTDISQKAILIGKEKYKGIKFIKADAESEFPFKNDYFDLVISGEYIEHVKDTDYFLAEVNRVLAKKGVLLLTTPNLAWWLNRVFLLLGRQPYYLEPSLYKVFPIISIAGKTFPADTNSLPAGHLRLFTLDMLEKLITFYGFSIEDRKSASLLTGILFKQIDQVFSSFPSLGFDLILKAQKKVSVIFKS